MMVLNQRKSGFAMQVGHNQSTGFTLIELMVTIAIAAILLAIAVPSLRQFLVRGAFDGTILEIRGAVGRARSEAIARGNPVTFGPSTVGVWNSGYEVFVDPLQRGIFTAADVVGATDDVRKAERLFVGTVPQNSTFSWPATTSDGTSASAQYFMFDSRGRPITSTGASGNASLPLCVPTSAIATNNCREIVVDVIGRVTVNPFTKAI
jgi:type IV fimbrial biogenesis protein FimT